MRRPVVAVLALLAAAVPAAAARADYVIEGHGWGHGVGLSQYGAYGYASREGRDFRWIVGHYFTGTTVGRVPAVRMRVLLRRTRTPVLCGATALRDATGRRLRLQRTRRYRFAAWRDEGLAVFDGATGHRRARVRAPVTVAGPRLCLRGSADNGVRDGSYRGAFRLWRDGRTILVVDRLTLEQYLSGVVAAEMPASWPAEALKAQTVVARSYALRSRRPATPFDVYADTRSQVYGGIASEAPATVAAVRATQGLAVRYGTEIAQTFFSSSSGGRTAANEEAFAGGAPVPYLRSVDDPYDVLSPYHSWTVTLADGEAARRLQDVRMGDLRDIVVTATGATGRVASADVVGAGGTASLSGGRLYSLLGLRSAWFTIHHVDAPQPRG